MNARALNALAGVICRAQKNGKRTPMGIAIAIESAQMMQSPETAAELEHLRSRVAELEIERHTTNTAVADLTEALRTAEDRQAPEVFPPALPWARWLDAEDLADFLDELAASAITHASSDVALVAVEKTCGSWRAMAEATRAHLTAPGPSCTCTEPVLDCTGAVCGCPVCHRALVPAAAVAPGGAA